MAETERQANITIEAGPLGLAVKVEYTGSLVSISAAIERLRTAGVLELVSKAAPVQQGGTQGRRAAVVTYADDGTPVCANANCSRHGQPLEPSQHNGYYCKGKDSRTGNAKGYCKSTAE